MKSGEVKIRAQKLTVGYGSNILMKNIDFDVCKGDIFIIMGASGGGKSSLLRVLTGLMPPLSGNIWIDNQKFTGASAAEQNKIMQKCGILYQSGALFSSMTLAENVALPLQQYSGFSERQIAELVSLKLALVGFGYS